MIDTPFEIYQRICHERDRYKQERAELLQVLFRPQAVREAVSARILGVDENEQELDSGGNTQARGTP